MMRKYFNPAVVIALVLFAGVGGYIWAAQPSDREAEPVSMPPDTSKENSDVHAAEPIIPSEIATVLRASLPAGWTIKSDIHSIVITRDEQVTLLNPINLPSADPEEVLPEFGWKTDYMIILVFKERMLSDQYVALKQERDQALKTIMDNPNINVKTKFGQLDREKDRYPLPMYYNSRFSIYLSRTDPPPLVVYPESAAKESSGILEELSKLMKKYPEDPLAESSN